MYKTQQRTKLKKRAHTIHTCAQLEYSGIHKYSYIITIFIIITESYGFIAKALQSQPMIHQGQLTLEIYDDLDSSKLFQLPKLVVKGLKFHSNTDNSYIIQTTKSFPNLQLLHVTSVISCNKLCVHLQTLNYLEELAMPLIGTYKELSSLIPLIKPGRPIKYLQLTLLYDDCTPLHMLFYPSSLEKIELDCYHLAQKVNNKCEFGFNRHLISQNTNLKEVTINNNCPDIFFINSIQLLKLKISISFSSPLQCLGYQHRECSKICIGLLSYKHLKEIILFNNTHEELSSIVPLIQPGRPLRHLQLKMTNERCPPIYMLHYPSSLERLQLFCYFVPKVTCEANFNKSLISQNTNLKELEISVNCPYWDTILLSLAQANTSKLRSLMTYHHNKKSLIISAANTKLYHHLITFQNLEELAITTNGTEEEIFLILQLIQPGRPLRYLQLTLISYGNSPPIHMLLYPSSLEKLELLCSCYDHVNVKTSIPCELSFNKNLISQNTNLKELVITTSCPCIEMFSSLLINTKISTRAEYIRNI